MAETPVYCRRCGKTLKTERYLPVGIYDPASGVMLPRTEIVELRCPSGHEGWRAIEKFAGLRWIRS